jgi:hypothetical protein
MSLHQELSIERMRILISRFLQFGFVTVRLLVQLIRQF